MTYRPCVAALLMVASALPVGAQGGGDSSRATSGTQWPAVVGQGRVDPRLDVNFSALVTPATVYVGQQATYQIGVFLSEDVRQRLRRNPEFIPPDVRSMVAYDLPTPTRPLQRSEGGREYDVHVFQRALFPLTAGRHTIAPARLTYALPLSSSFFSREESHSARTTGFTIIAREPPTAGRPDDWQGAVGRLALAARLDTAGTRVGVPFTLTVAVSGVGNVSLLPRPALQVPWAEAVPAAERVVVDTTSVLVQGRKEFEWVVTPRRSGALELPTLRYPYWNPYTERYEVAATPSMAVRVVDGAVVAAPSVASEPDARLPLRRSFRGALPPPLSTSPMLFLAMALVPIPALALGAAVRPRRSRVAAPRDQVTRFAAGAAHTPSELRRAFAAAIAERTGVAAAAMTDSRAFVRTLRRSGVTLEGAQKAQLLLAELDRAVYGNAGGGIAPDLAERARATVEQVDQEAKPRRTALVGGRRPMGGGAIVALVGGALAVASIAAADAALDLARFERGVEFYEKGFHDAAMREFHDIARRAPRAADAWANLGTAAWEANDTATAVIGWQRALRLEPLAEDMRARLEQTPGFRAGILGDVPPIPTDGLGLLAAALWVVGWGGIAWMIRRRRPELRAPSLAALFGAGGVALGTVAVHGATSGDDRVVIVAPESLRNAPALAADQVGDVLAGEAARERGRQGGWVRLSLPDGRSGWIETRRVASLDVDRAP